MINLKDTAIRHQLINRYLDANTSVEEEEALADFYRHGKESELTDEDLDIRNMMLGLGIVAQKEQQAQNFTCPSHPHQERSLKSVRISAILLAAAMLAGLIFLVFPIKDHMSQKPNFAALAPTTQVIRSQQMPDDNVDLSPAEQMERQDSIFLASTKDIVTSREAHAASKQPTRASKTKNCRGNIHSVSDSQYDNKTENHGIAMRNEQANNDFHQLYEVASLALPTAEELTIDKQGNHIVISTTDDKGNTQHYTVEIDEAQDGLYQFHPLAQLDDRDI